MPRVAQHVLAREVVEFARVGHERHQIALALLQQLVNQPHRVQIRHVDIRRAVQHQQRALEPFDVRQRRRVVVDLRVLLRGADAARRPAAVVRILVIHRVVGDAGDVDRGAEQLRLIGDGDQRKEAAVAQAPHADAIHVDVGQRLQIVRHHPRVLGVLAADVHVDAFTPRLAVADAAAIVRHDHDVALLQQVLMEAVIHGVIALHVPAVVALVHAVAVNPDNRRMLLGVIEPLRHEQPRRHLLAVRPGVAHRLRLDERGAIHPGRHRVGQARRTRRGFRVGDPQVRRIVRIGVLEGQPRAVGRPQRSDVGAPAAGDGGDRRRRGIGPDRRDGEMPIAVVIRLVRVERDARAVRRPLRRPDLEPPFGDLDRRAAGRGHHIQMIPAVAVAEKRDPLPVRRRLRPRVSRDAPELVRQLLVNRRRIAAVRADHRRRPALEVWRGAVGEEMRRIEPAAAAEAAAGAERSQPGAVGVDHAGLARHVFADRVDDLRAGVRRRLLMANRAVVVAEDDRPAIGRPARSTNRVVVGADDDRLFPVSQRADDEVAPARSTARAPATPRRRGPWRRRTRRPHERDPRPVGRQRDPRLRLRRRPHRGRIAAAQRDLPEIALPRKVDALAVGAPEQAGALAVGVARQRAGARRRRSGDIGHKNVGDAGALRQKCQVPPVGRPHRVRGMADIDQLVDRQRAIRTRRRGLQGRVGDERRRSEDESDRNGGDSFHGVSSIATIQLFEDASARHENRAKNPALTRAL